MVANFGSRTEKTHRKYFKQVNEYLHPGEE
jgi:hypothetical protein